MIHSPEQSAETHSIIIRRFTTRDPRMQGANDAAYGVRFG